MRILSNLLDHVCLAIVARGQRVMCERDRPAREAESVRALDIFESFRAVWPFGGLDLVDSAQRVFCRLDEDERASAIRTAPLYLAAVAGSGRKRMSASAWLRAKGWMRSDVGEAPVFITVGSPQWLAWEDYHRAAKDVPLACGRPLSFWHAGGRGRMEKSEWPPALPGDQSGASADSMAAISSS